MEKGKSKHRPDGFDKYIRTRALNHGISLRSIANNIDVPEASFHRMIKGPDLKLSLIYKLAEIFGPEVYKHAINHVRESFGLETTQIRRKDTEPSLTEAPIPKPAPQESVNIRLILHEFADTIADWVDRQSDPTSADTNPKTE